jgi:hypothetical protein
MTLEELSRVSEGYGDSMRSCLFFSMDKQVDQEPG